MCHAAAGHKGSPRGSMQEDEELRTSVLVSATISSPVILSRLSLGRENLR